MGAKTPDSITQLTSSDLQHVQLQQTQDLISQDQHQSDKCMNFVYTPYSLYLI